MKDLTARDHAYIYGIITMEALDKYPQAKESLISGIKLYGNQRGARMAQYARKMGEDLSMQHYLAFGEWSPAPGEMDIEIPQETPDAVWKVKKCPWNTEWTEKGMLEAGKLYCRYVDQALVAGFNRNLQLFIGMNQSNGDPYCYFKWQQADMTPEHKQANSELQGKIGKGRIRSWEYHCAHIYKTLYQQLCEGIGTDKADLIYDAADKRIASELGKETVKLMHLGRLIDFWQSPAEESVSLLMKLF